ncbi:MAG: J domain-containing protein [Dechloromonas sp.]|nr:J domain-containing protein [Dechloromonas sp.]
MKQTTTYYDLLEVSRHADLAEISTAYLRISRALSAGEGPLGEADDAFQLKLVKHAYEVLSNPSRRSDYDAGLITRNTASGRAEPPLQIEVAMTSPRWSPIRRLLTIIASLMIIGMILQISVTYLAYQRTTALTGGDTASPAAEKAYLQDVFQTYGIRAASRAEADSLVAEIRQREEAEREEAQQQRLVEQQAREQRRFEEESRRLGAEVSANLRRAEQEAERAREEEIRRKDELERRAKEEDLARRQREIDRFRARGVSSAE